MPVFIRRALLPLLALFAICACSAQEDAPGQPVVLAASSLQDVMGDAADAWARRGHARPQLSFAASSALARQVESGAPADIYVSADLEWMDYLAARDLIRPGSRTIVASNALVLVAPADDGDGIAADEDIGAILNRVGEGRIAMGEPEAVPVGRYGKAALESLGLWQSVRGRIAPAENVRAALALVESREAPLGIVYATDAAASKKVRVVAVFPPASHPPIEYPGAVLTAADDPQADAFLVFLASPDGQTIFAEYGFGPPAP